MTCCLLVTLRFRPSRLLAMRLGRHWQAWLAAIAVVELAAAWLLVRLLADLSVLPGVDEMASMREDSNATAIAALALVLAALALGVAVLRIGPAGGGRVAAYSSFGCFAVALLPLVRTAASQSHLVLMGQLMLLMAVAPALFASTLARPARAGSGLALVAAGGYLIALYGWHLPSAHRAAMSDPGWDWVLVASIAAAGLLFWSVARSNLPALLVVGAGSGLLGLALTASQQPLFAMARSPLGLGALTDQRLAGLLMMAVDVLVLVPMAARAADAETAIAAPAAASVARHPASERRLA